MSEQPAPTLPADRAFVVHFQTTNGWRRRFAGRAEHLSSGTSIRFGSLRELVRFLARVLDAPHEPHNDSPPRAVTNQGGRKP